MYDQLNNEPFSLPKRLIEYATENPLFVLAEIFDREQLDFLKKDFRDWFHVAIINNESAYGEGEKRASLLIFCQDMELLFEALFLINKNQQPGNLFDAATIPQPNFNKIALLNYEQISNPIQVIFAFHNKFSIEYMRRELWNMLEASVGFTGSYPENMNGSQVLFIYEDILCLVEAAYTIYNQELGAIAVEAH